MAIKQCKSEHMLKDLRCQGVVGHEGPHWGYDAGGHDIQWKNKKDKSPKWKDIGASWTPPNHKNYIHPKDMDKYYWKTLKVKEEINKELDKNKKKKVK